jgi:crotonobetainyl-CoA:carnitine CoA-transferase CaiB-like acyl-CoA transferase
LTALEARHRSGVGQFVDVSMTDGVAALLPVPYSMYKASGRVPERGNELLSGRYACYNLYRTSDGRWLSVGALEQKFWAALCGELGCPELTAEQFAGEPRQSEIKARIASIFTTDSAQNWFERLRDKDCCVAPVRTIEEIDPIRPGPNLSRTPPSLTSEVPALGEHTGAVLRDLGFSDDQIEHLAKEGITG